MKSSLTVISAVWIKENSGSCVECCWIWKTKHNIPLHDSNDQNIFHRHFSVIYITGSCVYQCDEASLKQHTNVICENVSMTFCSATWVNRPWNVNFVHNNFSIAAQDTQQKRKRKANMTTELLRISDILKKKRKKFIIKLTSIQNNK